MTPADPSSADPGPVFDPRTGRHVLQPILLDTPGHAVAPRLYLHRLAGEIAFTGAGLWLGPGGAVGFNTYANSFYAAYWGRFTELSRFEICGRVRGRAFLRLFRVVSPHSLQPMGERMIGEKGSEEFRPFHVTLPMRSIPTEAGAEGRVFFDIVAREECEIDSLAYATAEAPRQAVSLSLGICTFGKEAQLLGNLENIERYLEAGGDRFVDRVFVVNNAGAPFALPGLAALAGRCPRISVITQRNLGGAGGFTRSLVASLAQSPATHHVMIDDDVFIDPFVIDKVARFLMYVRQDLLVGGQMMNLRAPHILYEGGARLDENGLLHRVGVNIDCADTGAIGFFDRYRPIDYNAWWFCAIPKARVAEVGLPMNIFIRGDDFEYGTRMAEAGVLTVSLPGIYVWHEPFEQKTAAWLEYYNTRNRNIYCAAHSRRSNKTQPPPGFYRGLIDSTLVEEDYEKLAACLLGIADFLAGPERFHAQDAEANHNAIRALLARARAENGRPRAGAGYQAVLEALEERIPGLEARLAEIRESIAAETLMLPDGTTPEPAAREEWRALAEAVLAALLAQGPGIEAEWAERALARADPGAWQAVFGTDRAA